jgi:Domain of unknown function (DUF4259)
MALAAAATVAASMTEDVDVPESVSAFLAQARLPDQPVRQEAVRALDRLESDDSELRELWKEAGSLEEWIQGVTTIRAILTAASNP